MEHEDLNQSSRDILGDVEAAKKRVMENAGIGPDDSAFPSLEPFFYKGKPASRMSGRELVGVVMDLEERYSRRMAELINERDAALAGTSKPPSRWAHLASSGIGFGVGFIAGMSFGYGFAMKLILKG